MTERAEMEAAVEAVLFVSSEPVPRERLAEIFDEGEREAVPEVIDAVVARYAVSTGRGVFVEEVAGGLRLVTRPEMNPWLRRFFEVTGRQKLSMAAIETLAIIAYRQPMTAPEVQDLRGVNPSGVLKTLLERRLLRIAGRKEVVGRPFLYATTREFLVHFGLKSLKDLPDLEDLDEAFEEGGDIGEPAAAEGGLEGGAGVDREERILQRVAAIDEAAERAAEEAARDDGEEGGEGAAGEPVGAPTAVPAGGLQETAADAADGGGERPTVDEKEGRRR
ncbi:MAG TPA: SMC-Scp complex subunit ScpB [Thermoanaerobaculia bacterium]|nr:SMC-Scp complex subunit ScpB [Thermoanaerobaculia bacterium]